MQATRREFLRVGLGLGWAISLSGKAEIGDLLGAGGRLLEGVLDPAVLEALRAGDRRQLEVWLRQAAQELQEGDVLDLASMQDAADLVLPLLESHRETRGYGAWLRARMDYFDVADFFRHTLPRPGTAPDQPPPRPMTPTPEQERKAWQKQMERREQPKGASNWVPKLKPLFKGAGVPGELVWLAEVESAFDPEARSPVGAAGMYQLMPATARDLGLQLSPRDERLIPERSARAAAAYLRRLHRQFGDWPLALAAYNAGPGRVADTLKRRRARSFDAIAPDLPAETQMYVPKFEAVLRRRENRGLGSLKIPARA